MSAAVDTNVLLPVIRGDSGRTDLLVSFLDRFIQSVGLVICGPVYSELAAAPGMQIPAVDWDLSRTIWLRAAATFRAYANRRQAAGHGWPRRILADFVIGAHAELHADFLLTYNSDDFGRMFPDLQVIVPPGSGGN